MKKPVLIGVLRNKGEAEEVKLKLAMAFGPITEFALVQKKGSKSWNIYASHAKGLFNPGYEMNKKSADEIKKYCVALMRGEKPELI